MEPITNSKCFLGVTVSTASRSSPYFAHTQWAMPTYVSDKKNPNRYDSGDARSSSKHEEILIVEDKP